MKFNEFNFNQIKSIQFQPNQFKSNQIKSIQIKSNQVKSNQTNSISIKPNQVKSNQTNSISIKSNQINLNPLLQLKHLFGVFRLSHYVHLGQPWRKSRKQNVFQNIKKTRVKIPRTKHCLTAPHH